MSTNIKSKKDVQHATRNTQHATRLTPPRLTAFLLFLAALLPRLPGLDRFLISDEKTNIFIAGSDVIAAFLRGDLRGTYWHFYPGVTMSWLDAVGMAGQYLLDLLTGTPVPPFIDYIYSDILSLVVATRLPYAILTAAAVPVTYLLIRQLLPERVVLLGVLFMAFDPFYLAHSRVVHGDAPVAVFMSLSALTFFTYAERAGQSEDDGRRRTNDEGRTTDDGRRTTKDERRRTNDERPRITDNGPRTTDKISFRISNLSFILHPSAFYLIFSAILGSLAALTKAPGQFMPLFIIGLSIIYAGHEIWRTKSESANTLPGTGLRICESANLRINQPTNRPTSQPTNKISNIILRWLVVIAIWGLISLAVFFLLWPSMWVDPTGTFRQMWEETFGKVNEGHLVYFFGQPTLDPGPWFYFYVIPFRLTPVVLIGCLISLVFFIPGVNSHLKIDPLALRTFFLLWLFTISLLLFGNLSPKKQDRYLLPLFPFINLLAAIGWLGLFNLIYHLLKARFLIDSKFSPSNPESPTLHANSPNPLSYIRHLTSYISPPISHIPARTSFIAIFLLLILLLFHFSPVLTYYPYYLTYFNPLMGGPTRAAETTLMGWGEGMEQVATYLNTKPNAGSLYVASTPSQTLLPYFAGTGENFYTNDVAFRADYVVLYLAQMQRLAPSPEIVGYFQAQLPEKVITIKDVPYAKIYPGPKLILTGIPPEATPINIGLDDILRLAGYRIQNLELKTQDLKLTLYWHALAPLSVNYTISVRARAADGRILAQRDSWPAGGLLPTTQWRQGDYVADTHTLTISGVDIKQVSNFEVVVYDLETDETLGPPIALAINNE